MTYRPIFYNLVYFSKNLTIFEIIKISEVSTISAVYAYFITFSLRPGSPLSENGPIIFTWYISERLWRTSQRETKYLW
jgi:hypothetical protein